MPGKKESREKSRSSQLDLWEAKQDFQWEDFRVAREYVQGLKLKNHDAWESLVEKGNLHDSKIPINPDRVYKNHGWSGWNDWLGIKELVDFKEQPRTLLFNDDSRDSLWSGKEASKWMNFHEACQIVRGYGFEYEEEWNLFVNGKFSKRELLPDNIPMNPDQVYRFIGWKGWKDWLVQPEKQIEYSEFYKAREFVRSCRIPDKGSWRDFLRGNASLMKKYTLKLPARPHLEYRNSGWDGWEDWLGTELNFHDFISTKKFVHSLKLKNKKGWFDFCFGRLTHKPNKTEKVYTYPDVAFKDKGWKGWEDWLGILHAKKVNPSTLKTSEIIIDCKCKGRIKDCPICDGKGYYVHVL